MWKGKPMADWNVSDVECLKEMHHVKWCAYTKNFISNDSFSKEQRRARPESRFSNTFSNPTSRAKATPSNIISENGFRVMAACGVLVSDLPLTHVVPKRKEPMSRGAPQLHPRSTGDRRHQPPLPPEPMRMPPSEPPHARVASVRKVPGAAASSQLTGFLQEEVSSPARTSPTPPHIHLTSPHPTSTSFAPHPTPPHILYSPPTHPPHHTTPHTQHTSYARLSCTPPMHNYLQSHHNPPHPIKSYPTLPYHILNHRTLSPHGKDIFLISLRRSC